jgi:hypothetical protein
VNVTLFFLFFPEPPHLIVRNQGSAPKLSGLFPAFAASIASGKSSGLKQARRLAAGQIRPIGRHRLFAGVRREPFFFA